MCGIVFASIKNNKRASRVVMKRYEQQSKRGKQGYGAVTILEETVKNIYRSQDVNGIRKIYDDKCDTILFHHRTPTSTPNYIECTHPILVSNSRLDSDYLVVHNGVISNAAQLRTEFERMGYVYTTTIQEMYISKSSGKTYPTDTEKFNDSESLAIDLAIAIEDNLSELKSRGTIAFVALQINKESGKVVQVFFGRNSSNPLKLDRRDGNFVLASEGMGEDVVPHRLYSYDIRNGELDSTNLDVGINYVPPVKTEVVHATEQRINDEVDDYMSRHNTTFPSSWDDGSISRQLPLLPTPSRHRKLDVISFEDRLETCSVNVYDEDGKAVKVTLEVPILDDKLYRTSIDLGAFHLIMEEEWFAFLEKHQCINDYTDFFKNGKKHGIVMSDEDRKVCGGMLTKSYTWLKEFSNKINHRAALSEKF